MKLIYTLCLAIICQVAAAQELTPQAQAELKSVFSEEKMQNFMENHPDLSTMVVFINSFDDMNKNDSLLFLLGLQGVREVRNELGTMTYYKLFDQSTELEYKVRTIFLDGTQMAVDRIHAIQTEILQNIASGQSFESQYEKYNMDDRQNNGEMGWVRPETLLEPFTSLVKMHPVGKAFSVDIPYMNWFFVAENVSEPAEQTRKKFLSVTVNP